MDYQIQLVFQLVDKKSRLHYQVQLLKVIQFLDSTENLLNYFLLIQQMAKFNLDSHLQLQVVKFSNLQRVLTLLWKMMVLSLGLTSQVNWLQFNQLSQLLPKLLLLVKTLLSQDLDFQMLFLHIYKPQDLQNHSSMHQQISQDLIHQKPLLLVMLQPVHINSTYLILTVVILPSHKLHLHL